MDQVKFKRMREITEEHEMDKLNVGDDFLYGINVIGQKANKAVGESITYYRVISKNKNGSIEYTPIFDYMEGTQGDKNE